jgi:hypothetical protein
MQILLGAGSSRTKRLGVGGSHEWVGLHTLDFNADHKPDTVHDLNVFPYPFEDNSADQIHAYEVVEHLGQQGDFTAFFAFWSEIWRILEPGGFFMGTSPLWSSPWAWGDPGHTRIISRECLTFLCQPNYVQVGKTPMTDYRFCYRADFDIVHSAENGPHTYEYALQAVKPSRINV